MFRTTYLRKFLIPGSLSATVLSSGGEEDPPKNTGGKLLRRTELPIYVECPPRREKVEESPSNTVENGIGAIRKELWVWHDSCKGYREKVVNVVVTARDHTSELVEQLRKDELPVPRSGAVAIGGLAGVVLGLRGGWMKRIIYGSTCAGIMAAVCYPKEFSEVSQTILGTTKKYVIIAYNFIYGEETETLVREPVPVYDLPEETPIPLYDLPEEIPISKEPCKCNVLERPPCRVPPEKTDQGPYNSSSSPSDFDRLAEESADVMYWGFRLK